MARKATTKSEISKQLGADAPVSPFAEPVVESPAPKPVTEADLTETRKPRVFKVKQNLEPPVVEAPPIKKRTKRVVAVDPFSEIASSSPVKKTKTVRAKTPVKKAVSAETAEIVKPKRAPAKSKTAAAKPKKGMLDVTAEIAASAPAVEVSPVFKALADVKLPELKKENRARLLLQSPTKIYFYWTIRENPWHLLRNVFRPDQGSYTLVLKLADLTKGAETLIPVEAEGEHWFDVEPDREYQAEIGFYAPNRPYFRIVYSNKVATPRRSPSPHPASDARWTVSANKFAEVLDVSGFTRDAVDVAIAGDDPKASAHATHLAFSSLMGGGDFTHLPAEDLRYAMLSLAAGVPVEELGDRVSPAVINAVKSAKPGPGPGTQASRTALKTYFDIDEAEWSEEHLGSAVHGESLLHFPKTLRTRTAPSTYRPQSSHSIR
jgi:hypothetical protein